jgi:hypothetical protein
MGTDGGAIDSAHCPNSAIAQIDHLAPLGNLDGWIASQATVSGADRIGQAIADELST